MLLLLFGFSWQTGHCDVHEDCLAPPSLKCNANFTDGAADVMNDKS